MINSLNILNKINRINGSGGRNIVQHSFSDATLTATPASNTAIDLEFAYPSSEDFPYSNVKAKLFYRVTGTTGWNLATYITDGVTTTYQKTGLTQGISYDFMVRFVSGSVISSVGTIVTKLMFNTISTAYFAAMTEQLPSDEKNVIDDAIWSTATQIAKMDCMMLTLATEQQSLLYLNDPTKTGVKVNSPTFTPYKGWSGDATNYIDTGFNPGDGGTYNLTQDNATISFYSNKYINLGSTLWAGNNGTALSGLSIGVYRDGQRVLGGINDDGSYFVNTGVYIKEFLVNRRDGSSSSYRNFNLHKISRSVKSAAVQNGGVKIALTENRGALFFAGSFLDDGELSSFMNAWLPVLEHLGSDYWSNFVPTTLTATAGAGKIDLAWTLPVTTYSPYTVTNVVIQESEDNVTFTDIATLGAVEAYEATVPTGQTRYYKIRYISSRNIHTTNSAEAHATAL